MKPIKYIGVALVAAAALGVVACDNGNLSGPDIAGANSSAVENPNPQSSNSDPKIVASSSSVAALSSGTLETCVHFTDLKCESCPPGVKCTCNPCDVKKAEFGSDCKTGAKLVCKEGEWNFYEEKSSSSVTALSSGAVETCLNVSGKVCAPCMEGYKCPCNPCEHENVETFDCATGGRLICKDGEWNFIFEKSSSSSQSNFSISDKCLNISSMCPKCNGRDCPQSILPCNHCESAYDLPTRDCETGVIYVCENNLWQLKFDEECRDFVNMCPPCDSVHGCNLTNQPCNQCDSNVNNAARDCETGLTYICTNRLWRPLESPYETCKHITDFEGSGSRCPNQNGSSAVDCITKGNYQCKDDRWQQVACMNVKPDECKPGMGGCGYRLCEPNGIKEIADCENSVVYVCNGETWEVKKTEENQHCARGELEYCGACYREGEFEGRYKCEGGKWKKYGMGDDTCEHITDVKCEFGNVGCGACNVPKNGGIDKVKDCATNQLYVCRNGFWDVYITDCESMDPASCGIDEYKSCRSNSIIGTACENGATKVIDDCSYACSNGTYIFVPPPM